MEVTRKKRPLLSLSLPTQFQLSKVSNGRGQFVQEGEKQTGFPTVNERTAAHISVCLSGKCLLRATLCSCRRCFQGRRGMDGGVFMRRRLFGN